MPKARGAIPERLVLPIPELLRPFALASANHPLHEISIVVLWQVSVFPQVRPVVLRHRLYQIFNELVRNQGMAKVQLGNVGLGEESVKAIVKVFQTRETKEDRTFPSATSRKL